MMRSSGVFGQEVHRREGEFEPTDVGRREPRAGVPLADAGQRLVALRAQQLGAERTVHQVGAPCRGQWMAGGGK